MGPEQISRRDAIKMAGRLGSGLLAWWVLNSIGVPMPLEDEGGETEAGGFEPQATQQAPEEFPETLPEQVQWLTKELRPKVMEERRRFWMSEQGRQLYRLSFYDELVNQEQVEGLVASPWLHVFVGGLDGQAPREDGNGGRQQVFDIENCDAPASLMLNMNTGQVIAMPWDRGLTMARGMNFQGDGDVMHRVGLTSSPQFKVLGAQTPFENIAHSLTLMTGYRPDFVLLADMDGARMVLGDQSSSEEAEQDLTQVRDRKEKPAGDRSLAAVQLVVGLAQKLVGTGLVPLVNEDGKGLLERVQYRIDNYPDYFGTGPSGSPLVDIISVLKKLDLSRGESASLVDNLIEKMLYVRLVNAALPLVEGRDGVKYFDELVLLDQVQFELDRERDYGEPLDHDYALTVTTYSNDTGHEEQTTIPYVDGDVVWKLPQLGVSYDLALTDDMELERLRQYWSLLRTILGRYLS